MLVGNAGPAMLAARAVEKDRDDRAQQVPCRQCGARVGARCTREGSIQDFSCTSRYNDAYAAGLVPALVGLHRTCLPRCGGVETGKPFVCPTCLGWGWINGRHPGPEIVPCPHCKEAHR